MKSKVKESTSNIELIEAVEFVKDVFGDMQEQAAMSSTLLNLNIQDSFSKMINDSISNPLRTSFSALKSIESLILEQLNSYVVGFLVSHKDIINNAFQFKNNGGLIHYTITLKNDSLLIKEPILNFLSQYERSAYASRFPIVIQDIPSELADDLSHEIKLGKLELVF